jgi:prolyl-tRNA editing enzyme YbaK/EbsC (Cys-tRNA(Pro) deacylase)
MDREEGLEGVAAVLGASEVRLAQEEEEEGFAPAIPDCEVGAMPPFGDLYGLPVYVEEALAEDETIVVQAGTHSGTIRLKYADCERLVSPTVARFAYHTLRRWPFPLSSTNRGSPLAIIRWTGLSRSCVG